MDKKPIFRKKSSPILKIAAGLALFGAAAAVMAAIALRFFFPAEKVRGLIEANARKALRREVRLKGVSAGLVKGLALEGLEISEPPDFKAGTFAAVDLFQVKVRLRPLLHKRVIVDRIAAEGVSLNISKDRKGRYNFEDLASSGREEKKAGAAKPAPGLPFALDVRRADVEKGSISYRDASSARDVRLSDIKASARDFTLSGPFDAALEFRARQGRPGGLDADVSFAGKIDVSGMGTGKLAAAVDTLAVKAGTLDVALSGRVRVDGDALEIPDLKGKVGDGTLSATIKAERLSKAPSIVLEASLSRLDLGKITAKPEEGAAASAGAPQIRPPAAASKPAVPIKVKGSVKVDKIVYGSVSANETRLSWDLGGITPALSGIDGWAKLHVDGGTFDQEGKEKSRSALLKVALLPLTILKTIGGIGGKLKILPDFNHIVFTEIAGDYVFRQGVVSLREFSMRSAAANVSAKGSVDLPNQKLDLLVTVMLAKVAPIDIGIGGTFDRPSPRVNLGKTLQEPVKKLLTEPALKIFKNIFKR